MQSNSGELQRQIRSVLKRIEQTEQRLERMRGRLLEHAPHVEKKLYLRGKYEGFVPESLALMVRVEGGLYHYSLQDYDGCALPPVGAQVLLHATPGKIQVHGFVQGKMIPPAPRHLCRVVGVIPGENAAVRLADELLGRFSMAWITGEADGMVPKMGSMLAVRKIQHGADFYLVAETDTFALADRGTLLQMIQGAVNE